MDRIFNLRTARGHATFAYTHVLDTPPRGPVVLRTETGFGKSMFRFMRTETRFGIDHVPHHEDRDAI